MGVSCWGAYKCSKILRAFWFTLTIWGRIITLRVLFISFTNNFKVNIRLRSSKSGFIFNCIWRILLVFLVGIIMKICLNLVFLIYSILEYLLFIWFLLKQFFNRIFWWRFWLKFWMVYWTWNLVYFWLGLGIWWINWLYLLIFWSWFSLSS